MTEATKTVKKQGVWGDLRYVVYEITNAANGETITTPFNDAYAWWGTNETTTTLPFGASKALSGGVAVLTLIINSTTDEYRVMVVGK